LTHSVDADLLYRNYLYVSGTTKTLLQYFDAFVDKVEATRPRKRLEILDIGSNDGTLLSRFQRRGHSVLGVDPAENLRPLSGANGVPTRVAYWGLETARSLQRQFDVVIAMNALGHLPYPDEFLLACRDVLAPKGRIYIQTSQCEMVERFEFDTIYHEHHSFFTAQSFRALADRVGLTILDGEKVSVHGTSYRWTLGAGSRLKEGAQVRAMIDHEDALGYYSRATYDRFRESVTETVEFVRRAVLDHREGGYLTVGYGAAAKGNNLLNLARVNLEYVVDDNPLKIDSRIPGTDTRIIPFTRVSGTKGPLCILVLAWNFYDEIRARVAEVRQRDDDVFIRYFPERKICSG
jgi:2-polyprenyl-3-methyl-5-hydroxy-6-metoxy-1,4-benzoquinol methylase